MKIKLILTLFYLFVFISCISKGKENISGENGPQDITINLLKISPPSVVVSPNEVTEFKIVGGNEPYVFSISSGYGSVDQNGKYTAPATLGNNTIKVTDAAGNSVFAVVTVGSSLQASPASKTMGTNQSFTLVGSGGVAPYTFSIVTGGGSINASTGVYTSGASPETVNLKIQDTNGDNVYCSVTVVDALTVTPTTVTLEDLSTQTFSVAGGTAPYTYQVYSGAGAIDSFGLYTAPATTGTEIVRITDSSSNHVEATVTVKKGPNPSVTDSNLAPGQVVTISNSEGDSPYSYTIQSGLGSINNSTGVFTAPSIASTTVVRVTDNNGFYSDISLQTYNLKKVAMGDYFACSLHIQNDNVTSEVKCWGQKEYGVTGLDNTTIGDSANEMGDNLAIIDFGASYTPIGIYSSNASHRCAIFSNNELKCWGNGATGRRGSANQSSVGDLSGQMGANLSASLLGTGVLVDNTLAVSDRVALGQEHSCVAINSNNTIKCFGEANFGRLGYANQTDKCTTTTNCGDNLAEVDIGAGKSVVQIATGLYHTCALLSPDYQIKCWGDNAYGQLGIESTTDQIVAPKDANFVDLGTGRSAQKVTVGLNHTCALLDNYEIKCWGYNAHGQLGQENTTVLGDGANEMGDNLTAIDMGSVSYPISIQAAGYHTCAIFNNGGLKCWGRNNYGQLGLGSTASKGDGTNEMGDNLPFVDVGTALTVSSISLSEKLTCAITSDNALKCWGDNTYGQLGIENTDRIGDNSNEMGDNLTAVNLGTGKTASMVSAAANSVCALLNDSKIKCWGLDESGNLGLEHMAYGDQSGETVAALTKIDFGTGENAKDIFAGRNHVCAILTSGKIKCWGNGGQGRLGYENANNLGDNPNELGNNFTYLDLGSGLTATSGTGGNNYSCAVLNTGDIKCWGDGANGRRGSNDQNDMGDGAGEMGDSLPAVDLGSGRTAKSVHAGDNFSCAHMDNDQIKCFGYNGYAQLGQGNTQQLGHNATWDTATYGNVDLGSGRSAKQVSAGIYHMCILMDNHKVKCWGRNNYGQTGYETTTNIGDVAGETGDGLNPVDLGTGRTALSITTSERNTCAILDNYSIKCWGDGSLGQLGAGTSARLGDGANEMGDNLPAVLLPAADKPLKIYSGYNSVCIVTEENKIKCWGYNPYGNLGHGHRFTVGTDPLSMDSNLPTTN